MRLSVRLLPVLLLPVLVLVVLGGCPKPSDQAADQPPPPSAPSPNEPEGAEAPKAEAPPAEPKEEKADVEEAKWTTTDSGLKYQDLVVGTGPSPKPGARVFVHYVGKLKDGTKFDASKDHGTEPFDFTIGMGEVIKGWDEGVMTMKVGGKRNLVIPADLGYGAGGSPPVIPPNAELHFMVELVDVK